VTFADQLLSHLIILSHLAILVTGVDQCLQASHLRATSQVPTADEGAQFEQEYAPLASSSGPFVLLELAHLPTSCFSRIADIAHGETTDEGDDRSHDQPGPRWVVDVWLVVLLLSAVSALISPYQPLSVMLALPLSAAWITSTSSVRHSPTPCSRRVKPLQWYQPMPTLSMLA
jgi:hypothetical protein